MPSSEVPMMAQEQTEVSNTQQPALLLLHPGASSKCFQATKNLARGWLLGSMECAWPPKALGRRQRGGEQPAMSGYGGILSASLLSQRFWAARLLREADGQQGLKRCQRKSMGRHQARKSLARVKLWDGVQQEG